jgi:hypothetical protein
MNILFNINSNDRLTTTLYSRRDDFNFAIVSFSFLCSNIPLSSAYGVRFSQFIQYTKTFFPCENFLKRGKLLTKKFMLQAYNNFCLKASFCKFYSHNLLYDHRLSQAHMLKDLFLIRYYTVVSLLTLMVGVTDHQRMHTPPCHLIRPSL